MLNKCPFCGGGTFEFKETKYWTGMRYHIISLTLYHWCDRVDEFDKGMIQIVAKTKEDCIKFWNRS